MQEQIVNKIAESGLITLDLEEYYPKEEIVVFDIKDHLFMGMMLKEKDFRASLQGLDWEVYRGKNVAVTCSAQGAIVPLWSYMLVTTYLQPVAKYVAYGDAKSLLNTLFVKNLSVLKGEDYTDKRIVVKGCADVQVPEAAYLEITNILRPFAKSIMYGEPCSTVPIFKKKP
ncbi:DUF2480 family protein [Deminuibacter soli]|uniref:DUF2480 family protein n=1 Tax=Deminuibacter soli TaxID=2291815 RepID=A0A3E1NQY9_9BACT|nr:DUF2480 family protein [Deminuibacter soli]RFM30320.1 DUF2480 family protein [Deminuibacter soli]